MGGEKKGRGTGAGAEAGACPCIYTLALHTNSEELVGGVVDAGGSVGLAAVVAAITAVEAEQAAGRVISSR